MIKIENLTKSFDGQVVIKDCNLEIKDGAINGLIGENGAGKSTLLRLIAGVLTPDTGTIALDGEVIFDDPVQKAKIFFLCDDPYYGKTATLKSLSTLYSCFFDGFTEEEFRANLRRYGVDVDKPLNTFSKGMRRKSYISAALTSKAEVILIDEAFDGLDPYSRHMFKKDIVELISNNPKTTVIIASHSLRELEDICDSYSLVDNGSIDEEFMSKRESNLLKVRLAFAEEKAIDLAHLHPLMEKHDGRFLTVVLDMSEEEIHRFFDPLNPVIMDISNVTLEEAFIYNKEREML